MLARLILLHKKINLWSFYITSLLLAVVVVGFWFLLFIAMIFQAKTSFKDAFIILLIAVITSFLSIQLFLFTKRKYNEVKNETIESQEKKMEEWKAKMNQLVDMVKQSPLAKPQFKIQNPIDIIRPTEDTLNKNPYPQDRDSPEKSESENFKNVEYLKLTAEDFKKLNKIIEKEIFIFNATLPGISNVLKKIKIDEEDIFRSILESYPEVQQASFLQPNKDSSEGAYHYYLRNLLKTGFELNKANYASLFKIVEEVTTLFQIKPKIRIFKVKQGGTENAFVISSGDNLILAFCDNLLNLIKDEKELRYVVGHELGHFVYKHGESSIHNNIFALHRSNRELSYDEKCFLASQNGLFFLSISCLIRQIQELNADRAGLFASGDFESSVSASLKVSAGNIDEFGLYNSKDYLKQATHLMKLGNYFELNDIFRTHPIEALRVKALEYFYLSDLYSEIIKPTPTKYKTELFIKELFKIIPISFMIEGMEKPIGNYITGEVFLLLSAYGVMLADKKKDRRELDYFKKMEIQFSHHYNTLDIVKRTDFLNQTKERQTTILKEYAEKIKEDNPDYARIIIDNMIQIAKIDSKITFEEIQFILTISEWMNATDLCQSELQNHFGWKFALDEEGNVMREA
ncbi:MAG: M48 family metalloprotease [Leptospiraceae bacterium]|nr:M48 family metalloprotease [Leptospiraceae bacterium]MBK9502540.1 M48 family metalloprotease [Leptospiraceae bacterium]MBP9163900.1 M48 family metalloprotease [Leptospiraceae bacterium]